MSAANAPSFAPIFQFEEEREEGQRASHREEHSLVMAGTLAEEAGAEFPPGQGIVLEEAECKGQASLQQAAASHGFHAQQPPRKVTAVPHLITSLEALPVLSSCDESLLAQGRQGWLGKTTRPGHNEADEDGEDYVKTWWNEGESTKQKRHFKNMRAYMEHVVMRKREAPVGAADDELLPDEEVLAAAFGAATTGDLPVMWPYRGATTEFSPVARPNTSTTGDLPPMMRRVGETIVRPGLAQGEPADGAAGEGDLVEEADSSDEEPTGA